MNDERVQRALDGELPFELLDQAEAERYHQYRQAFAAALRPLGRLPEVDVTPRVFGALGERRSGEVARPPVRRQGIAARMAAWVWTPRAFTLRPAFGLAAAALAFFAWTTQFASSGPDAGAPAIQRMVVEFRLAAPDAGSVSLVGDFNSWQPVHQLRQVSAGVWSVSVTLEPGVYDYGFLVNGKTLRLDPLAPRVSDGFGGESSRLAVLAPEVSL
ncbi:MAG TPA: isoamylase early set domain-containing protein [Gemmatimonadales bacterium]|nr:isoamylase early set domain-containing protein [Gemmatimonadales bacterium]